MHAIQLTRSGGPEVLDLVELPDPVPDPDQLLVDVSAAGVNFSDTTRRASAAPEDLPMRLGSEGAGTVVAVGSRVTDWRVGDRVVWDKVPGSYASRVVVDAAQAIPVPDGVDPDVAAAGLHQGITAHYLTESTYRITAGQTALVTAAAGGVGRLLTQLLQRRGGRVIACTSSRDKADALRRLGVDEVLLYDELDAVPELTDGRGVDVVYDSVGKDTFDAGLDALRPRGTMVVYGQASGPIPPVDLARLVDGSLVLTRVRLPDHVATPQERQSRVDAVLDLLGRGELDVAIHGRYPLAEAARAHADMGARTTIGKLLLVP